VTRYTGRGTVTGAMAAAHWQSLVAGWWFSDVQSPGRTRFKFKLHGHFRAQPMDGGRLCFRVHGWRLPVSSWHDGHARTYSACTGSHSPHSLTQARLSDSEHSGWHFRAPGPGPAGRGFAAGLGAGRVLGLSLNEPFSGSKLTAAVPTPKNRKLPQALDH
jgi:hypothetical protein